jgi:hypothetical protein
MRRLTNGGESSPAHHFPGFERAAAGAIYRRAREGRGKFSMFCRVPRVSNARLLRRPGDRAIGGAIGLSTHELVAAHVQLAGNCALGGLPVVFLVE